MFFFKLLLLFTLELLLLAKFRERIVFKKFEIVNMINKVQNNFNFLVMKNRF